MSRKPVTATSIGKGSERRLTVFMKLAFAHGRTSAGQSISVNRLHIRIAGRARECCHRLEIYFDHLDSVHRSNNARSSIPNGIILRVCRSKESFSVVDDPSVFHWSTNPSTGNTGYSWARAWDQKRPPRPSSKVQPSNARTELCSPLRFSSD